MNTTNTTTNTEKKNGRGKTSGACSFASARLKDLVDVLGLDALVPVSRKFAEKLKVNHTRLKADAKTMAGFNVRIVAQTANSDGTGSIVALATESEAQPTPTQQVETAQI